MKVDTRQFLMQLDRQLRDGDITEQKALLRILRILGELESRVIKPLTFEVMCEEALMPERCMGGFILKAATGCTIPTNSSVDVRTGVIPNVPEGYGLALSGLPYEEKPFAVVCAQIQPNPSVKEISVQLFNPLTNQLIIGRGEVIAFLSLYASVPAVLERVSGFGGNKA